MTERLNNLTDVGQILRGYFIICLVHSERLKARGEGDDREQEGLDGITNLMDTSLSKLREMVKDREAWCAAVHSHGVRHDLATEQQSLMFISPG